MIQAQDEQATQTLINALLTGAVSYNPSTNTYVLWPDGDPNPAELSLDALICHLEFCGAIPTVCDLEAVTRQVNSYAQGSHHHSGNPRSTAHPAA